jgi:pyrroloquinoline quinone (PQQ) biosynthesis protein C
MFEKIRRAFEETLQEFTASPALRRLAEGDITAAHYASYLHQVFHHTRENPQIQTLAAVYFRGTQRDIIRRFFAHASSEIGHDQLALDDLAALGEDVQRISTENPLPATTALIAFPFFQIQHLNPVGYLGYLFFLEFTPTQQGARYMERLASLGVPKAAMTFLRDHTRVDVAHNKMMEEYVDVLVVSEADLQSVIYALRTTQRLYAEMVRGAFEQADRPMDWGFSPVEAAHAWRASASTMR